jgi:predicted dehydrogenase
VSVTARPSSTLDVVLTCPDGLEVRYRHGDDAAGYRYRERLAGPGGALMVDDQHVSLLPDGRRRTRTVRTPGREEPDDAVLDEFLRALAGGQSAPAAPDNLLTVATVAAVAEARREGGTAPFVHG